MKNKSKIVKDASNWKLMDGDNSCIRKINSYLTCRYIMKSNMPSNECLVEAKYIYGNNKSQEDIRSFIASYLEQQFESPHSLIQRGHTEEADEIIGILNNG